MHSSLVITFNRTFCCSMSKVFTIWHHHNLLWEAIVLVYTKEYKEESIQVNKKDKKTKNELILFLLILLLHFLIQIFVILPFDFLLWFSFFFIFIFF
jgi:nitrate reductase NapE component